MAYNDLASNLLGGFKTGYGIGSDLRARAKEDQFTSDVTAAEADAGSPDTADYYAKKSAGLEKAYAAYGKPLEGIQAGEAVRGQLKGRLQDNFQQIYALANTGTPEAMARANDLMKSTNDLWPNGQALHAVHDPQGNMIHAQTVNEATGQPAGPPMSFDAPTLKELARSYLTDVSKMTDQEIAQKAEADRVSFETEQNRIAAQRATQEGAYQKGSLGIQARAATAEEGRLTLAQAQADREERQRQFEREQKVAEFAAGGDARAADVTEKLARAGYYEMAGAGKGAGKPAWDQAGLIEADNAVHNIIRDGLGVDDPMRDTIAAATVELMHADPTGQVSPSMAFDFVRGIQKDRTRYSASPQLAPDGTRTVTDLQTRRTYQVPDATLSALTGQPAPRPAPPPAIGAGGRGPIHEQPMTGAGGRGPIDPRAVPAYGIR